MARHHTETASFPATTSANLTGMLRTPVVRATIRTALCDLPADVVKEASLLVEELIADAGRGGASPRGLELRRSVEPALLTIAVTREKPRVATREPLSPAITVGRILVEELALSWGTGETDTSSTTWAVFDLEPRAA
ncbi:hypothetical protein [Amycolatopsis sp. CA-230715]|uniref:hypothetical protein n=1 Tax=Amycolatopsis sp. CA-230715 TaxID=2745196 RepID=UPI001C028C1C|nr:hypothetical protein [Amycolatopsis sp. CA-230715]QWF80963.1 hypothetical protein HUW46_04388 [Amycolatopsis sp. CA-230715]